MNTTPSEKPTRPQGEDETGMGDEGHEVRGPLPPVPGAEPAGGGARRQGFELGADSAPGPAGLSGPERRTATAGAERDSEQQEGEPTAGPAGGRGEPDSGRALGEPAGGDHTASEPGGAPERRAADGAERWAADGADRAGTAVREERGPVGGAEGGSPPSIRVENAPGAGASGDFVPGGPAEPAGLPDSERSGGAAGDLGTSPAEPAGLPEAERSGGGAGDLGAGPAEPAGLPDSERSGGAAGDLGTGPAEGWPELAPADAVPGGEGEHPAAGAADPGAASDRRDAGVGAAGRGEDDHREDDHGEDDHREDDHGEDDHREDHHREDHHREDHHREDDHREDDHREREPATPEPARRLIPSPAGLLIGLLISLLGFALAVQVRSNTSTSGLTAARQEDLVRILDELSSRENRLRRQIAELEAARTRLSSTGDRSSAALEEARKRSTTLGVLAGTLPAQGPGVELTLTDPERRLAAEDLLDAVEELRAAGAEALQVGGVRIGLDSSFTAVDGGIAVDGVQLSAPYTILAIGDPPTLATAMEIPGGVTDTVSRAGGEARIAQRDRVVIRALRPLKEPQYSRPSDGGR